MENKFVNPQKYYYNTRPELLKFIPNGIKSMLDVGCGAGTFLNNFNNRGIVRIGIEPNREASIVAQNHADFIINDFFTQNSINAVKKKYNQPIDCIFFNDVLEHLEEPWQALEIAKQLLSEEGVIIASIPNFLFYSNLSNIIRTQDIRYESSGIMDVTHLRFFSKKSIIRLFTDVNFEITNIEGINPVSSIKFKIINFILMNRLSDLKYIQFVVVARLKKT
ncbi:MAG: class I SAM-dependent methyltransferase [Haliscomenobacter sp.]|uniref:class I SAM-dependent methyltransferase n=1 Tax=Haliscomenobacter sp. TaxID=2717303 RepID=UPI0029A26646|nr:class I SAM-dependent methyltransferase [Haliscomenobacter sp.]MDX2067862.1 class I SAM-dependent methyltransferase [Haliscomenobacter sp.]